MNKLLSTEASIDKALEDATSMMAEMAAAQRAVNASAVLTDPAFAKVAETIAALQTARSAIVSSHRRLDKIREVLGLRTVASIPQLKEARFDDDVTVGDRDDKRAVA